MANEMIRVKPVAGRKLPMLGSPTKHVSAETDVPNVPYYRRALRRGDIDPVKAGKKTKAEMAGKGEEV